MLLLFRRIFTALLLAALLPLTLPGSPAAAQNTNTFTVNSLADQIDIDPGDGVCDADQGSVTTCTLRAAITEANNLGGAQTIRLPGGIYRITIPGINDDANLKGDFDITSDMTILGISSSARPIIDGSGLDRVFHVLGAVNSARLQNLSIRNGLASEENTGLPNGGGVFVETRGRVTIRESLITNNQAGFGGGVAGLGISAITIEASTLQNNRANGAGGVGTDGNIIILASSINNNTAGSGGGVSISGDGFLALSQSTIANNTATIPNSSFGGGGLLVLPPARASVANSTISGNSAFRGGGIAVRGIFSARQQLQLSNVTITRNTGGGLSGVDTTSMSISRTIIASNTGNDCQLGTIVLDGSRNLTGDNTCAFAAGTLNHTNTNPLLGTLAFNGGPTQTHKPLSGSMAIDRAGSTGCPTLDQRGIRRPQGASCDIGAFETASNVFLGIPAFALPPLPVTAEQTATLTLSWTVPAPMTWTDLNTVDFLLDAGEEQPLVIRFSQGVTITDELGEAGAPNLSQQTSPRNTLSLFDASGEVGMGEIGTNTVLENAVATLDLAQSQLVSDGPEGDTVTLTLALRLKQPLAGKVYRVSLIATDDAGSIQEPNDMGTFAVGPFQTFLSLIRQP